MQQDAIPRAHLRAPVGATERACLTAVQLAAYTETFYITVGQILRSKSIPRPVKVCCTAGLVFYVAFVMLVPQRCYCQINSDSTRYRGKQFVYEAYARWLIDHPDRRCPRALDELFRYASLNIDTDAWGNPFAMTCGDGPTPTLSVRSAGVDGQLHTADDVIVPDPMLLDRPTPRTDWP